MMHTIEVGAAELRVLRKLVSARGAHFRLNAKEQAALNSLEKRLMIFEAE
jgi:hypothetical protein